MNRTVRFLGIALSLSIGYAAADTITTVSTASWAGTLTGTPTDLFASSIPTVSSHRATDGGFTFAGSNLTNSTATYNNHTLSDLDAGTITITPPTGGESAFELLVEAGLNSNTSQYTLIINGNYETESFGWIAFDDSTPITSLQVATMGTGDIGLLDVQYGTAIVQSQPGGGDDSDPPSVPEASTSLLTGGGMLLLLFSISRKLLPRKSL